MRRRSLAVPPAWWLPLILVIPLAVLAAVGLRTGTAASPPVHESVPVPVQPESGSGSTTATGASTAAGLDPCERAQRAWVALATTDPADPPDEPAAGERLADVRAGLPPDLQAAFDRWWTALRSGPTGAAVEAVAGIDEWFARTCP